MEGFLRTRLASAVMLIKPKPVTSYSNFRLFASTQIVAESKKNGKLDTALNMTPSCISRLRQITSPQEPYLRISISGGGCSGFQYSFEMDSTVGPDDTFIKDENGTPLVVVDSTSLSYITGSTVDYYEELIRTGFRIVSNPQAEGGCSCGASFNIKM